MTKLRPVEVQETGELRTIAALEDEIKRQQAIVTGLERDIRGWAVRYRQLAEDKAQKARDHHLWPILELMFREWRRLCNHPKSAWTTDRFWAALPFAEDEQYGASEEDRLRLMRRAIAGIAFDPFVTKRKNGTAKRHDGWDLLFRSADKYEEFANRAPKGWRP